MKTTCRTSAGVLAAGVLVLVGSAASAAGSPTCSDVDFLGVDVHGQHVVRDYVVGTDGGDETWPYSDNIGQIVAENGGAAIPGGPGPGFHFVNGVAPGASFCTDSESPGVHVG